MIMMMPSRIRILIPPSRLRWCTSGPTSWTIGTTRRKTTADFYDHYDEMSTAVATVTTSSSSTRRRRMSLLSIPIPNCDCRHQRSMMMTTMTPTTPLVDDFHSITTPHGNGRSVHSTSMSSSSSHNTIREQHHDGNDDERTDRADYYYRLLYFNTRGEAEPIRYFMAIHNIPYQDVRYPIHASAKGFGVVGGGGRDEDPKTFISHQTMGYFKSNMGRLPILQILQKKSKHQQQQKKKMMNHTDESQHGTDEQQQQQQQGEEQQEEEIVIVGEIGQTYAILRFLANRYGAMGDTLLERANIDAFVESVRDIKAAWYKAKRNVLPMTATATDGGTDPSSSSSSSSSPSGRTSPHQSKKDFLSIQLPEWCRKLEESLPPKTIFHTANDGMYVGKSKDGTVGHDNDTDDDVGTDDNKCGDLPPISSSSSPSSSSSSPWLIGNRLSLADICLYSMLSTPTSLTTGSSQSFFDGALPETIQQAYIYNNNNNNNDNSNRTNTSTSTPIENTTNISNNHNGDNHHHQSIQQPRLLLCPRIYGSMQATSTLKAVRQWEDHRPDTFN